MIRHLARSARQTAAVLIGAIGLGIIGLAVLCAGCVTAPTPKQVAITALVATVDTIDDALPIYDQWEGPEEHEIARMAVAGCDGLHPREAFMACTANLSAPRRAKIDRVRAAKRVYRQAVELGADAAAGNPLGAAMDLIRALGDVGIVVKVPG